MDKSDNSEKLKDDMNFSNDNLNLNKKSEDITNKDIFDSDINDNEDLYNDSKKKNKLKYNKVIKNANILPNGIFWYRPDMILPNLCQLINFYIEFKIEKKYICRDNINVKNNKIWGTDAYTHDSDPVCILFHSEKFNIMDKITNNGDLYSFILYVSKSKKNYNSSKKNGILSKKLNNQASLNSLFTLKPYSFKVSKDIDLDFCYKIINNLKREQKKRVKAPPKRTGNRSSTIFCNHIIFNFLNESCFHYCLENICDKSENSKFNLGQLLDNHCYYFYTNREIFELSKMPIKLNFEKNYLLLQLSKIKNPFEANNLFFYNKLIPLEKEYKELLIEDFELKNVIFGNNSIKISNNINNYEIQGINSYKIYSCNEEDN